MRAHTSKVTNDPWAAMDALIQEEQGPTGPEWFTIQAWAERYNKKQTTAKDVLGKMFRAGKLERWNGVPAGYSTRITKYRVKP